MSETYPAAPWRLSGHALAIIRIVPIERIAPQVPKSLSIVPLAPGRTLSIFYVARYAESSTVQYHECIVAPALVRKGPRIGAWISNIYVDNELSMRAGRDIWGLPKQLATFDWRWEERGRVAMTHDEASFELTGSPSPTRWPLPVVAGAFGTLAPELTWFAVRGGARIAKGDGKLWTRSNALTLCDFDSVGPIYSLSLRKLKIGTPTHLR
jgi:hypothetical protein